MKSLKHLNRHLTSFSKLSKTKIQLLGFCFLFVTVLVSVFFITRGPNPHVSELAYIEHSNLGKEAGSMIPASCNSAPPTSHFNGDCVTTCPGGVGTYDSYFDPTASACPVPTVTMPVDTTISYGGVTPVWYTSTGASTCTLYVGNPWTGSLDATYPGLGSSWNYPNNGGPYYANAVYAAACYNGGSPATTEFEVIYVCPLATPVYSGGICQTTQVSFAATTPTSCTIATGATTCPITLGWTTTYPAAGYTTTIQRDGTAGVLYTANTNSVTTNVPYEADGTVVYRGYHAGLEKNNISIGVSCASGVNKWDTVSAKCVDPQVVSPQITDQHYPPGDIRFSCTGASTYSVIKDGAPFIASAQYTGPVVLNNVVTSDGNYGLRCTEESVSDTDYVAYDASLLPAVVDLDVSVTTVDPPATTTVTWEVEYPSDACTLTATIVCANNACTAAQTAAGVALNAILSSANTDPNDPNTSRAMTTAITRPAPGHKDSDTPLIVADYKAIGKKSIPIKYTTDLTYNCNGTKETKRIRVTKSEEQ